MKGTGWGEGRINLKGSIFQVVRGKPSAWLTVCRSWAPVVVESWVSNTELSVSLLFSDPVFAGNHGAF